MDNNNNNTTASPDMEVEPTVIPMVLGESPPARVRRNFLSLLRERNGPLSRAGKLIIILTSLSTVAQVIKKVLLKKGNFHHCCL
jgi:hypothetical protein